MGGKGTYVGSGRRRPLKVGSGPETEQGNQHEAQITRRPLKVGSELVKIDPARVAALGSPSPQGRVGTMLEQLIEVLKSRSPSPQGRVGTNMGEVGGEG